MINRSEAPVIKDAVDFQLQLKPYEKFVLDNGVEVYAVNAGAEEVIQLEWVFDAGNWYEKKSMVAPTVNYLLKNGTGKYSAFEMNEAFEYYGAYLNRACYNETAALTLHCLSKHVPLLLPKVADILCDAIFSEEEIAIYKQNSRQRLQVNLKKCDFVANRLIDEYLFGIQHPYGKYSTFEAIEAIERQDLLDFYDQYYRNGKLRLFVAGKLPSDLFALLNTHFGKLNFNKTPLPEIAHPVVSAKNIGVPINIINDTNGVQGAIRLASHFPNHQH